MLTRKSWNNFLQLIRLIGNRSLTWLGINKYIDWTDYKRLGLHNPTLTSYYKALQIFHSHLFRKSVFYTWFDKSATESLWEPMKYIHQGIYTSSHPNIFRHPYLLNAHFPLCTHIRLPTQLYIYILVLHFGWKPLCVITDHVEFLLTTNDEGTGIDRKCLFYEQHRKQALLYKCYNSWYISIGYYKLYVLFWPICSSYYFLAHARGCCVFLFCS